MADSSFITFPRLQSILGGIADATNARLLDERALLFKELAARDAQILALQSSLADVTDVVDGLLAGVRDQGKELGAFRRRVRDVEDRLDRRRVE